MSQFFHDVHGRASSVGALPNPLSMTVRTMYVETGAISLGAEMRSVARSVNVEVITGTSGTVTVVASEETAAATNSAVLGLAVEVWSALSSALVLATGSST